MKKGLFILATAAVVLAGCNNDVVLDENVALANSNEPKEITLSPLNTPVRHVQGRRAPIANDAAFPTTYRFFLSAYAVDGGGDYFGKAEYANESSTIWSGISGQKQYWPLSDETLNFLAVTKSDADGTNTTFGTASANFASKVVVGLTDNHSSQHDLMYAYQRAAVVKTGNTLSFNGGNEVDMEFKHTQAWVNFTVKAADAATAGAGLVVTGIQLKGAVYEGTATVTLANYNSKSSALSATLAWDGTAYTGATPQDVDVTLASSVAVNSTSEIAAGNGLMIVPNPNKTADVLNPSISTFVISYTFNGQNYTFEYTPTDAQKRMEPAHKYNFNVTFTLTEIKVDASVENWAETNYGVNVPNV